MLASQTRESLKFACGYDIWREVSWRSLYAWFFRRACWFRCVFVALVFKVRFGHLLQFWDSIGLVVSKESEFMVSVGAIRTENK
jgi:hypothetical protein